MLCVWIKMGGRGTFKMRGTLCNGRCCCVTYQKIRAAKLPKRAAKPPKRGIGLPPFLRNGNPVADFTPKEHPPTGFPFFITN